MGVAQLLSVLWATLFLTANLLHPLTHNPLHQEGGDCLVCVLHQTAAAEPPADPVGESITPSIGEPIVPRWAYIASHVSLTARPQIPRAPPA